MFLVRAQRQWALLLNGHPVNQPIARRAGRQLPKSREAAKKAELIKASAGKGPRTIATVTETANKAARRRDVLASKLAKLGVVLAD